MSSKKHVVKGKKSKPKNHKGEQKKIVFVCPGNSKKSDRY